MKRANAPVDDYRKDKVKRIAMTVDISTTPSRPAATGVVVRRDGATARVLMGRRHPDMRFLANYFVFPGGGVDEQDRALGAAPVSERDSDLLSWRADGVSPASLMWALARELLEETGLAIRPHADVPETALNHAPVWSAMIAAGYRPCSDRFRFIFRAITPKTKPIRFDARFFLIPAENVNGPLDELAGCGELLDLQWLTFEEARDQKLPSVTRHVLNEVERCLETPDAERPVPMFYQDDNGRRTLGQVGWRHINSV